MKQIKPNSIANGCEYTNDNGNQASLLKWCAYFDVRDKLVAAYLLSRDLKNWTQLTTVDARAAIAAQQPAKSKNEIALQNSIDLLHTAAKAKGFKSAGDALGVTSEMIESYATKQK